MSNADGNGAASQEWVEMEAAVEALYQTFAAYPLRPVIDGCPHCVNREDSDRLHMRPLRELTPNDVSYYAFKAMTTFGDAADFKHFLPRLLELIAREVQGGEALSFDEEILGGKIALAEYATWPPAERAAVERFFMAAWQAALATFPSTPDAETLLCTVARFASADGLAPYLAAWRQTLTRPALFHLVATLFPGYRDVWWSKVERARFDAWLQDDDTFAMLRLAAQEWQANPSPGQFSHDIEEMLAGLVAG